MNELPRTANKAIRDGSTAIVAAAVIIILSKAGMDFSAEEATILTGAGAVLFNAGFRVWRDKAHGQPR